LLRTLVAIVAAAAPVLVVAPGAEINEPKELVNCAAPIVSVGSSWPGVTSMMPMPKPPPPPGVVPAAFAPPPHTMTIIWYTLSGTVSVLVVVVMILYFFHSGGAIRVALPGAGG
jgi:hypothetical protein